MWNKCLLIWCLVVPIYAKNEDPFHQRTTTVVKTHHLIKKYRYHGFLKLNQSVYAILKMVGADYELVHLGKSPSFGQVTQIEASRICIRKSGKNYCLNRSDTPRTWEPIHA